MTFFSSHKRNASCLYLVSSVLHVAEVKDIGRQHLRLSLISASLPSIFPNLSFVSPSCLLNWVSIS